MESNEQKLKRLEQERTELECRYLLLKRLAATKPADLDEAEAVVLAEWIADLRGSIHRVETQFKTVRAQAARHAGV